MKRWLLRTLFVVGGLILVSLLWGAFAPLPQDEIFVSDRWGGGAEASLPFYAGINRDLPDTNEPLDNPTTPEIVALGRFLFFDPVLSINNDMSCSTCHHPDLGFSDGRATGMGAGGSGYGPDRTGGVEFPHNTMSHWNVAFGTKFLWNGASDTLEQVVAGTIAAPEEFDTTPDQVVAELRAIPEYVELFDAAFGDGAEGITHTNIQRAIAAFQRTLISLNSPYDRFAAGDFDALTPQQRRGLALFRSSRMHCNDCHWAPTFSDDDFSVTGVPPLPGKEYDPGRAAVDPEGKDKAFKAPTLRNIALTAPYMHNGVFTTLEEVIDFYAGGGGREDGVQNVDVPVQGFDISESEKAELIAFLYALTDESALPEIPTRLPSGLPVVPRLENPAREIARQVNRPEKDEQVETRRDPQVLTVGAGQSIQSVIDQARTGDTVQIPYGIYSESIFLDEPGVRLIGMPNAEGAYPVLDGRNVRESGVTASGDGFEMAFLALKGYAKTGILVKNARGVYLHDLSLAGPSTLGLAAELCSNVRIEHVKVTGMTSAGVYAGSSEAVSINGVEAFGNAIGIELENSIHSEVFANHVYENTVGIFVALQPHLPSKVSLYNQVYDNVVENNNLDGETSQPLPQGIGILVLAADYVELQGNTVTGHEHAGLAVYSLRGDFAGNEMDVGINPEFLSAQKNLYTGNQVDIFWDGSGVGNVFDDQATSSPRILPSSDWVETVYRLYWRLLNLRWHKF
jgi:parallel beta-helix repeat protein